MESSLYLVNLVLIFKWLRIKSLARKEQKVIPHSQARVMYLYIFFVAYRFKGWEGEQATSEKSQATSEKSQATSEKSQAT